MHFKCISKPQEGPHSVQIWDKPRTLRFAIIAFPEQVYLTLKVVFLDEWFGASTSLGNTFKKAVVSQGIDIIDYSYWTIAHSYFASYQRSEDYALEDMKIAFQNNFFTSYLWNWVFWIPVEMVTYAFIPLPWQVPFFSIANIGFMLGLSWILNRFEDSTARQLEPIADREEQMNLEHEEVPEIQQLGGSKSGEPGPTAA
uniref:Uncharacterized protein n=1 Tax=Eutreptiella gymnastica TaxID=73025 RepID=A0A7S1J1I1_9EUGL